MEFAGYITSGRFAEDAKRFGFGTKRLDAASPAPEFLQRLPSEARAALEHIADMLKQGTFPTLDVFGVGHAWGFDFKAENVEVLDANFGGDLSGDVFSLATDGGGNHHCLSADGKVVVWNHEESNIEDHTQFASLDEALYALLHREAVGDDVIAYDEVAGLFNEKAGDRENGWSFLRDELEER